MVAEVKAIASVVVTLMAIEQNVLNLCLNGSNQDSKCCTQVRHVEWPPFDIEQISTGRCDWLCNLQDSQAIGAKLHTVSLGAWTCELINACKKARMCNAQHLLHASDSIVKGQADYQKKSSVI